MEHNYHHQLNIDIDRIIARGKLRPHLDSCRVCRHSEDGVLLLACKEYMELKTAASRYVR